MLLTFIQTIKFYSLSKNIKGHFSSVHRKLKIEDGKGKTPEKRAKFKRKFAWLFVFLFSFGSIILCSVYRRISYRWRRKSEFWTLEIAEISYFFPQLFYGLFRFHSDISFIYPFFLAGFEDDGVRFLKIGEKIAFSLSISLMRKEIGWSNGDI